MEHNIDNKNTNETINKKEKRNSIIIFFIILAITLIMVSIAINNFWLFIIICVIAYIIFSIINLIVLFIKKRYSDNEH